MRIPSDGGATGHFLQPKWGHAAWGTGSLQDRFDVVSPLITGRSVLDVGCSLHRQRFLAVYVQVMKKERDRNPTFYSLNVKVLWADDHEIACTSPARP